MNIEPIRTFTVHANEMSVKEFLDRSLESFSDHSILAVTSKVISLCEGNVVPIDKADKETLIQKEASKYIPASENKYGFHITIKNNTLIASSGIDESNADGYYVLWPKDPQNSANYIRDYLASRFHLHSVGVVITDSHVLPLRWGTVGTCIASSGFLALNSYIGKPDLFGRNLKVTMSNISEGISAGAVVAMGEGNESTPLAVVSDISFVQFQDRNPTPSELEHLAISLEDDLFGPILKKADWKMSKTQ